MYLSAMTVVAVICSAVLVTAFYLWLRTWKSICGFLGHVVHLQRHTDMAVRQIMERDGLRQDA
jgi:hypothetical protein